MSNERSPRALCSTTIGTRGTGLLSNSFTHAGRARARVGAASTRMPCSYQQVEAQLVGCSMHVTLRATVQLRAVFSRSNDAHPGFRQSFDSASGGARARVGRPHAAR